MPRRRAARGCWRPSPHRQPRQTSPASPPRIPRTSRQPQAADPGRRLSRIREPGTCGRQAGALQVACVQTKESREVRSSLPGPVRTRCYLTLTGNVPALIVRGRGLFRFLEDADASGLTVTQPSFLACLAVPRSFRRDPVKKISVSPILWHSIVLDRCFVLYHYANWLQLFHSPLPCSWLRF